MTRTFEMLKQIGDTGKEVPEKVFRPEPRGVRPSVRKEGDTFVVTAPVLERIIARVDTSDVEVRSQLYQQMEKQGINRVLKNTGAVPGDRIRCGEMEWEF
jgi:Obg family GTPase CgtA-like protein